MTEPASPASPNVTVELVARPPHTSFLVVDYDGLEPPTALFADLEMIGWTPPVLAPPPRQAIDWSTPNAVTGESFTVRNWRVEGSIVEPPKGSGPRGSWNPHEGEAFLRSVRGVLQRHDVTPLDVDGRLRASAPPPPPPAAAAPPPPLPLPLEPTFPKRRGSLRSLSGRLRDAADANASARAATAGGDARVELLSLVLSIPEDGKLAIRATAAPARFPAIEDRLRSLAVPVWFTTEEHEEQQNFRGSSVSTTVTKFKITALATPDLAEDALAVFEELGAKFEVEVLDAERAAALATAAAAAAAPPPGDEEDDDFALIRRRYPCVHLIVEPARADPVIDVIQRLGLQHALKRPTEIESIGSFRGTKHVTQRPAIAFDVWAPPAHAGRVLNELALVGGVDPDRQPELAWISAPEAPPVDESVPAAGDADPKARREIAPDGDTQPLDIDRDLTGLIAQDPAPEDVTLGSGSGDEVLTHR